jgi:hypothetical protein
MKTIFDVCQVKNSSVAKKNDKKMFQLQNIFVSSRDFLQVDMDILPFRTYTAPEFFFVRNLEDTCQS